MKVLRQMEAKPYAEDENRAVSEDEVWFTKRSQRLNNAAVVSVMGSDPRLFPTGPRPAAWLRGQRLRQEDGRRSHILLERRTGLTFP